MNLERNRLYTPDEILSLPTHTENDRLNQRDLQKLNEAKKVASVATMLASIHENADEIKINLGEKHETLPDVQIIIKDDTKTKNLDIEVVSFTHFSEDEGVLKFLNRTKLSPIFAYPEQTLILCTIDFELQDPTLASQKLSHALCQRPCRHDIFMLANHLKVSPFLAQLYPIFRLFE